jgi:hypothetical protein
MFYLLFIFVAFSNFKTPDKRKIIEANTLQFEVTSSDSYINLEVTKPDCNIVVIRHELSKTIGL